MPADEPPFNCRCQGTTDAGHPCLNFARLGTGYCYRHTVPTCERCESRPATQTIYDDGEPVDLCDVCASPAPRDDALHAMIEAGNRLRRAMGNG